MHGQTACSKNSISVPEKKRKDSKEAEYKPEKGDFEWMKTLRHMPYRRMHPTHRERIKDHPEYSGQIIVTQGGRAILRV
tara:strand:+ start:356 stop:592 length:237 start_codon:yes stop_codon:yes gene_type:complete